MVYWNSPSVTAPEWLFCAPSTCLYGPPYLIYCISLPSPMTVIAKTRLKASSYVVDGLQTQMLFRKTLLLPCWCGSKEKYWSLLNLKLEGVKEACTSIQWHCTCLPCIKHFTFRINSVRNRVQLPEKEMAITNLPLHKAPALLDGVCVSVLIPAISLCTNGRPACQNSSEQLI